MRLTIQQQRNLRTALKLTGSGILIALVYPVFADGFGELLPYVKAAFIGLIGGIVVSVFELDLFKTRQRNSPFILTVAARTFAYTVSFAIIVPAVMVVCESAYYGRGIREHFFSDQFQDFLWREDYGLIVFYALVFIAIIIFTREMSRKLGQGVLWNYITGKYFTPREEMRIFVFVDIRDSTGIAERLTSINYHRLVRDFFHDITEPVLRSGGSIYDYVGDQMRATWPMKHADENARCIHAYHYMKSALRTRREHYLNTYGLVPAFSTSAHCGEVMIGEIGDVKSQIVYMGDAIAELSDMEKVPVDSGLKNPLVVSQVLLDHVKLPALYQRHELDKGLTDSPDIRIFTLTETGMT